MYGLTLVTAATEEPLTVADVKSDRRIPGEYGDHDIDIKDMIAAARQYVENHCHRQLVTATWDLVIDQFPYGLNKLYIPKSPLQSVTSITYLDVNGASQTYSSANYIVTTSREPGYITLGYGKVWPQVYPVADAIRIRFVAGYGAASAVPNELKRAMKLRIGDWFENREPVAVMRGNDPEAAILRLLDQYRVADDFLSYGRDMTCV